MHQKANRYVLPETQPRTQRERKSIFKETIGAAGVRRTLVTGVFLGTCGLLGYIMCLVALAVWKPVLGMLFVPLTLVGVLLTVAIVFAPVIIGIPAALRALYTRFHAPK